MTRPTYKWTNASWVVGILLATTTVGCGQQEGGAQRAGDYQASDLTAGPSEDLGTESPAKTGTDQGADEDSESDERDASAHCPIFPIVLHHGFMAGAKMGGFVGAKAFFEKRGCSVFETEVAAVQTAAYRGKQLKTAIDGILAKTGAEKVHIVAHSQGGLDARYAISILGIGAQVASLSTLGTPHYGTPLADLALSTSSPMAKKALAAMLNMMGKSMNSSTPEPDTLAAVESMTEAYMKKFNVEVQDDPQVIYQSWSAKSGRGSGDTLKTMMVLSHGILKVVSGANDGVVPEKSARWGKFRGALAADHLDLIGYKLLDLGSPFEHLKFLGKLADEMAEKGL